MDPEEIIAEAAEAPAHPDHDQFRNRAAMLIAVVAAVLAIGGLGGGNATDEMIGANIHASDTWAFFQAKNVRQTAYEIAAEDLRQQIASGGMTAAGRAQAEKTIADYEAKIARYDDEPDRDHPNDPTAGEGKKQLLARAKGFEEARTRAEAQDGNFDLAEVFLQLAIVLGSVAILALNRRVLYAAAASAAVGVILTINGFFLLFPLPF
jgi:hypothetical protein